MGYNTAMMFLNDNLHTMRDDPEAGRKIYDNIITARRGGGNQSYCMYGDAVESQHADSLQVVVVGGNRIRAVTSLYYLDMDDDEKILRGLAEHLGYSLRKKKVKA